MKTNLLATLIVFLCLLSVQSTAQQSSTFKGRSQSFYLEFGGAGIGVSANYEFRFRKNQLDGLGLRAGIGGIHIWLIGDISVTSVPVELNYIFSDEHKVSFELGASLTYAHIKENFSTFFSEHESNTENVVLGYIPVGIRLLSPGNGFMARFNLGPMFNLSAPNLFDEDSVLLMVGISIGYMF